VAADLPNSLDELSPQWLTGALSASFPGVTVTDTRVDGVLNGSACRPGCG
jgi:hypothetical protein